MEEGSRKLEAHQAHIRNIVWTSCLLGLVAYGIVGYLVIRTTSLTSTGPGWLWPTLGILMALGSLLVPRMFAGRDSKHLGENTRGIPLGELLGWALADGVGVMGVVAVAFGASVSVLWISLAVGAILLLVRRPGD